jgi:hypothetical protein
MEEMTQAQFRLSNKGALLKQEKDKAESEKLTFKQKS